MSELRIRRMCNRYRVSDAAGAGDLQHRLDRMVADRLPTLLDRGLSGLYNPLGLPADSLVAVRRLNVRIHLAGSPAVANPELVDQIAESWSQALLSGLKRILSTVDFEAGKALVSDTLAIFPGLNSARQHQVRQLVRHGTAAWWSPALLGDEAAPPALPRLLMALARTDRHMAAATIVELARDPGPGWLARLDASQHRFLGTTLARAGPSTNDADWVGSPAPLPAPQRDYLRQCPDAGSAALLYCALRLAADQPVPADYACLERVVSDGLVAPDPAVSEPLHRKRERVPEGVSIMDPLVAGTGRDDATGGPSPMPVSAGGAPQDAGEAAASTDSPAVTLPLADVSGVPIGCGGLLFLVRFALRHWEQGGGSLNQAMLALGTQVLDDLFQRLSPAARRAAWRRDGILLQAFTGLREPIDDVDALVHPPAEWRWATATREAVATHIDAAVTAVAHASQYVLGDAEAPLSPLDKLLLRPGRLRVTDTHARLVLPPASLDIGLRRGGWDIDPGWVPELGRIIRFEYRD